MMMVIMAAAVAAITLARTIAPAAIIPVHLIVAMVTAAVTMIMITTITIIMTAIDAAPAATLIRTPALSPRKVHLPAHSSIGMEITTILAVKNEFSMRT